MSAFTRDGEIRSRTVAGFSLCSTRATIECAYGSFESIRMKAMRQVSLPRLTQA